MKFKEKLSFLRKQRGMTQLELAERLGISRQAVSRWEQGMSEPSTENLVSIGKLFDIPVDSLVNENVQLHEESTVQVAVAEEKGADEKHRKYDILKMIGIVIFAIIVILIICISLSRGEKNPVPMEDINKGIVTESETVGFPLG